MSAFRQGRARIAIGLVAGLALAMGAAPGMQYAAGHLFPSVGAYSYPQRPVFLGRATGVILGGARIVDTREIHTPKPGDTLKGLVRFSAGVAEVRVPSAANHRRLFTPSRRFQPISTSIAGVAALKVEALGQVIEADSVGAMAVAECGGKRSALTHVENLRVNGQPVLIASVPPFTALDLAGLRITVNHQWRAADGQIVVTALRVEAGGEAISIGYARAGLRGCDVAGSEWAAMLRGARPPADPFAPRSDLRPRDCGIPNALVGGGRCPVEVSAPSPVLEKPVLVLAPDPTITPAPPQRAPSPSPSPTPTSPAEEPDPSPLPIPLPVVIPFLF